MSESEFWEEFWMSSSREEIQDALKSLAEHVYYGNGYENEWMDYIPIPVKDRFFARETEYLEGTWIDSLIGPIRIDWGE